MIDAEHFPERAVDVPREIDHAARANFADEDLRDIVFLHARRRHLPSAGRDKTQSASAASSRAARGFDLHAVTPLMIRSRLPGRDQRMKLAGGGSFRMSDTSSASGPSSSAIEGRAEESRQAEVSRRTPHSS